MPTVARLARLAVSMTPHCPDRRASACAISAVSPVHSGTSGSGVLRLSPNTWDQPHSNTSVGRCRQSWQRSRASMPSTVAAAPNRATRFSAENCTTFRHAHRVVIDISVPRRSAIGRMRGTCRELARESSGGFRCDIWKGWDDDQG